MLRYLAPLVLVSAALAQDYYSVALDGAQEVPPTPTAGRGWGVVRYDPATTNIRIFVYYEGLTGPPVAAHLHQGPVGVNGPIVVFLNPTAPNVFTASQAIPQAVATALAANGTYINVHTAAFGGGEIRGLVTPATSTRFTGQLTGAQENPPTPSTATGTCIAFLHEPEGRVVYDINSTGLVNVIAAHQHQGAVGVNGPIIFGLNGANGNYCGVSDRLTAAQVTAMKANGMYMNIHTNLFPNGEIRAQLIRDAGDHWVAELDGAQETPPVATAGFGGAQLILAPNGTLSVTGASAGLAGPPLAAHVHLGPPGVAGGIVFFLTAAGGTITGTFTPTAADLTNLRAGNWYVNVHTAAFPGGEIRGQLGAAKLPTSYGEGCLGSNGVRPQSGATGFGSVGSPMSFDLYGALPGGIELFLFGGSRDLAGGVIPLPVELTALGLGAPRCYLLVDPGTILLVLADGFGCAQLPIGVPLTAALRGVRFYSQWVSLDPAANPVGFVTSSGLSTLIQ